VTTATVRDIVIVGPDPGGRLILIVFLGDVPISLMACVDDSVLAAIRVLGDGIFGGLGKT